MARGVALAGFMGVGKSTVGAALAPRLGLPFVDLDRAVMTQAGRTVSELFSCEGEAGFRRREATVLRDVLDGDPVVLALGGGTLHYPGNLEAIQESCTVVSLLMPLDDIKDRLGPEDDARPLWSDAEARFAQREAGYRSADMCVDVAGLTVQEVVESIQRSLQCR